MNIINQSTFSSLFTGARQGLLAAGLLLLGSTAQAMQLDLVLNPSPDTMSAFIAVTHLAGTDEFTATGTALTLDAGGGQVSIMSGTFDLTASINNSGVLASGTLNIGGTVASLGFNSGTLLTGNLTAVGFYPTGETLDFLFDVTGGDAASLYGSAGGVIMNATGFSGSFASDFSNNALLLATGNADVGAVLVPEPATVWLIGLGLLGLVGQGQLRRRTS